MGLAKTNLGEFSPGFCGLYNWGADSLMVLLCTSCAGTVHAVAIPWFRAQFWAAECTHRHTIRDWNSTESLHSAASEACRYEKGSWLLSASRMVLDPYSGLGSWLTSGLRFRQGILTCSNYQVPQKMGYDPVTDRYLYPFSEVL